MNHTSECAFSALEMLFKEIVQHDYIRLRDSVSKAKSKIFEYEALNSKESVFEAYCALKESSILIDKLLSRMKLVHCEVQRLFEERLGKSHKVYGSVLNMTEMHMNVKEAIAEVEAKLCQVNEAINKPHHRLQPQRMQDLSVRRSKGREMRRRVRRLLKK
jgi:hypothetical protein